MRELAKPQSRGKATKYRESMIHLQRYEMVGKDGQMVTLPPLTIPNKMDEGILLRMAARCDAIF